MSKIDDDDYAYRTTMDEVLAMTEEFVDEARHSEDDARLGAYLRLASRSMRLALEMYRDHLGRNLAEMKQGEKT